MPIDLPFILKSLSLSYNEDQYKQVLDFIDLFEKWNKTHNLSAIRNRDEILTKHIADSLSVHPYLEGENIIDVGTGGGFPGLPLSIFFPKKSFTLIDSQHKKIAFVQYAIQKLKLNNIKAIHDRCENIKSSHFDIVISRAFSSIETMISLTKPLISKKGIFLAMKGDYPSEELKKLPEDISFIHHDLIVPGLNAKRCLIILKIK